MDITICTHCGSELKEDVATLYFDGVASGKIGIWKCENCSSNAEDR